ncbi:Uncharacterised protein [uncultured archaeon]|nr:Uncharacterised protein [uncultured archaeon]
MERKIAKGVALFATLVGISQWLGQEVSFFNIMMLTLITGLILSLDTKNSPRSKGNIGIDNPAEGGFFRRVTNLGNPLRAFTALAVRRGILQPFYLFH